MYYESLEQHLNTFGKYDEQLLIMVYFSTTLFFFLCLLNCAMFLRLILGGVSLHWIHYRLYIRRWSSTCLWLLTEQAFHILHYARFPCQ